MEKILGCPKERTMRLKQAVKNGKEKGDNGEE
jgi:hypothetical protein